MLIIAKVCEKWNVLAKDKILWKTFSHKCDNSSDMSCVVGVRCTKLLGFRANSLTNFARSSILKVQNLVKSISEIGPLSILR